MVNFDDKMMLGFGRKTSLVAGWL